MKNEFLKFINQWHLGISTDAKDLVDYYYYSALKFWAGCNRGHLMIEVLSKLDVSKEKLIEVKTKMAELVRPKMPETSKECLDVAIKFYKGEATREELRVAGNEAYSTFEATRNAFPGESWKTAPPYAAYCACSMEYHEGAAPYSSVLGHDDRQRYLREAANILRGNLSPFNFNKIFQNKLNAKPKK